MRGARLALLALGAAGLVEGAPDTEALTAQAALVVDGESGRELWSRDAQRRIFPASLTKMMTCLLALESDDLSHDVVISPVAAATGESGIYLEEGERIAFIELVRATLIWSANDAAVAVAEAVGGDVRGFADMMTRRAEECGALDTHFVNPHGLHDENHYSTASDLAAIAVCAMRLPKFREIVATEDLRMARPVHVEPAEEGDELGGRPRLSAREYEERTFANRNKLLERWELCDGIKTGYTRQAGRCLAASAASEGWRPIAVVLDSKDVVADARLLLEWALASFELRTVVEAGQGGWRLPVRDGVVEDVGLRAASGVQLLLRRDDPAAAVRLRRGLVAAPVTRGDRLAWLDVLVDGQPRARVALNADADVALSIWGRVKALSLPDDVGKGLLCLAAGVLLLGTAAKAARAGRRRIAARRRAANSRGQSDRGRGDRDRSGRQGRSGPERHHR